MAKAPSTTRKKTGVSKALSAEEIRAQMAAESEAIKDQIGTLSSNVIKLKRNKTFELPDGSTAEELDVVIVDFTSRNLWYEGKYDENNPTPPACYAIGSKVSEMIPASNVTDPQSEDCASCPLNQFGSDGNGKACKNQRRLALLPPDSEGDDDEFMLMNVSPTAIKRFDSMVAKVARDLQATPIAVVVTLGFDEAVDYPSLTFSVSATNDNIGTHWGRRAEAQELLSQELDLSTEEAEAPKARTAAKRTATKRTAAKRTPAKRAPARR